jgi:hypothetical protein
MSHDSASRITRICAPIEGGNYPGRMAVRCTILCGCRTLPSRRAEKILADIDLLEAGDPHVITSSRDERASYRGDRQDR